MVELTIVLRSHPLRAATEDLIQFVYERQYGAQVDSFPDVLAALTTPDGMPFCAAGMRFGIADCWSECYLDEPIETLVSRATGESIRRNQILEISGLASTGSGVSFVLLRELIAYAVRRGIRLGVFTATRRLQHAIEAAHVPLIRIAPARRSRIANPERWGSYYEEDPWVCGIVDPHSLPWPNRLRKSPAAAPEQLQVA
jgi:hypothetical protein